MIPIGPFSELTGLSLKALRVYHEHGLLVPERIDEHSQERAYSPWQILRAARLSALRRAGMSLAAIAPLLDTPAEAEPALAEFEEATRVRRAQEDAALAEARAVLAAQPAAEVLSIAGQPHEISVRLPKTEQLGAITLAVAHLVGHEVPGYFADIARYRQDEQDGDIVYSAPLLPMPANETAHAMPN